MGSSLDLLFSCVHERRGNLSAMTKFSKISRKKSNCSQFTMIDDASHLYMSHIFLFSASEKGLITNYYRKGDVRKLASFLLYPLDGANTKVPFSKCTPGQPSTQDRKQRLTRCLLVNLTGTGEDFSFFIFIFRYSLFQTPIFLKSPYLFYLLLIYRAF